MTIETWANNYITSLSGDITSGATSLVVASTNGAPLAPQFRLRIDSELALVTAMNGTTFTITRGIEGTTASGHTSGTTVAQVLTSGGLVGVAGSVNLSDTTANLPVTGTIGRTFYPTDSSYIHREGASGWVAFGPIYPLVVPPSLGSWTQVNFGSGAGSGYATQSGSAIYLRAPANASVNRRVLAMTAPATGYTITAMFRPEVWLQSFPLCGVGWRDSATDRQAFLRFGSDNGANFSIFSGTCTSSTGTYATYSSTQFLGIKADIIWVRLQHDGVNRTISYSFNGNDFIQLDQRAYNDFPAASMNPDQVIVFADSINGTYFAAITLYSWKITQP